MNGYQKLRNRITALEEERSQILSDFLKFIENPDSSEGISIAIRLKMQALKYRYPEYSMTKLMHKLVNKNEDAGSYNWLISDKDA